MRDAVPRIRATLYLNVAWPPSAWRMLPRLEVNDDRTVWRVQILFVFVFTWMAPPVPCPTCLRPLEWPVRETNACPHPGHGSLGGTA